MTRPAATRPPLIAWPVGESWISVPARYETEALADHCPSCDTRVRPAAVVDETHGGECISHIAAYRCPACDAAWLVMWPRSAEANR